MIRIVATGTVADVERKTLPASNGKPPRAVTNFVVVDGDARLRCAAWGETATEVPLNGRVLIEGRMAGRKYVKDGQERTSMEVTVGTIEPLGAAAAVPDDDMPF